MLPGDGESFSPMKPWVFSRSRSRNISADYFLFARWDAIDVHFGGKKSVPADTLLRNSRMRSREILQNRCRELGVRMKFETEVSADPRGRPGCRADGINSNIRTEHSDFFQPDIRKERIVTYGWRPVGRLTLLHSSSVKTNRVFRGACVSF